MRPQLLCCLVSLAAVPLAHAASVDELLQKNLEARGGADKVAAIHTLKSEGKLLFGGQIELALTQYQKAPDSVRNPLNMLDAVFDLGLHQDTRDIGNHLFREFAMVARLDQSFGGKVAYERLDVFHLAREDLFHFGADVFVLCAEFGANRAERTAEHLAEEAILLFLVVDDDAAVLVEPLQRRQLR